MTSTWKQPSTPKSDHGGELLSDRETAVSKDAPSATSSDDGRSDAEDLHRLEESIRWLMNAGTGPGPRPAPPPAGSGGMMVPARTVTAVPGTGLRLLDDTDDGDTLRLDPDTLFVPRQRRGSLAASVAKVVVVSVIAAPTAYFIANWLQSPATPAPSDRMIVAAPLVLPDDQAGAGTAAAADTAAAMTTANDRMPDDATPEGRSTGITTVAAAEAVTPAVAAPSPGQPRIVTMPPAADAGTPAETAVAAAAPARPPLSPQEITRMVERGNLLFNGGDVVSARLLFRRAADAGNAAAATGLARTFDADVLAKQMLGSAADPEEAQRWYARARELGERDAGTVALH